MIERIYLNNFKKFRDLKINMEGERKILVGDNDSGKSSILLAIDLALSGSRYKVEQEGLEGIINAEAIAEFLSSDVPKISLLPVAVVEVFLKTQGKEQLSGKNNYLGKQCEGLRLSIEPNPELYPEILEFVKEKTGTFPFEYYNVNFLTFKGVAYGGYNRHLKHLFLDNSRVSAFQAMREFIKDTYDMHVAGAQERARHGAAYRSMKNQFRDVELEAINTRISMQQPYKFEIRTGLGSTLYSDLTITEKSIAIEHSGTGRQSLLKTEFSLKRATTPPDVVLIEEPENHLSKNSTEKLISIVQNGSTQQTIIATHSSLIASRLNLNNCILLGSSDSFQYMEFEELEKDTAKFFMKSPTNNILDLVMSKKTVLVEGAAEYMLVHAFLEHTIKSENPGSSLENEGIQVVAVNGLSFKRHIEVVNKLKHKVAIVRDNDGDYQHNVVENYASAIQDEKYIQVFADTNNDNHTFEKSIYSLNAKLCDELFNTRTRGEVIDYMLSSGNKSEVAFELTKRVSEIVIPPHIEKAIGWIRG